MNYAVVCASHPSWSVSQPIGHLRRHRCRLARYRHRRFHWRRQVGYNWQNWVFGIEADFQGSAQNGDANYTVTVLGVPAAVAETADVDWFGTVRGRLGSATGPWHAYFTGGWAYGKVKGVITTTVAGVTVTASDSETRTDGWTVGGGFEYKFNQNWSVGIEYLYLNFGGDTATTATAAGNFTVTTSDFEDHIVRARLNYHF